MVFLVSCATLVGLVVNGDTLPQSSGQTLSQSNFSSFISKSELMKEKSKYQRTINKKNEDHRNLVEEVGSG